MPLFFVLSGYLFHYENLTLGSLLRKLSRAYLIPYFFLCGVNYLLLFLQCCVSGNKFYAVKYIAGIFYSRGTVEWMPNCSPLWYLTAQFVALIIFWVICKAENKIVRYLVLPIGLAAISYLLYMIKIPKLPWNIDTACMAVVFISFGCWIKKEYHGKLNKFLLFVIALTAGIIGTCFNPIDAVSFDDSEYGNLLFMVLGAIGFSIVFILISKLIALRDERVLSAIGKHTIFIMAFDYFAGSIAVHFITNAYGMFVLKCALLFVGFLIWNFIANILPECGLRRLMKKC